MKTIFLILIKVLYVCDLPAYGWDIAVAVGDQIQFLNATGELMKNVSEGMENVRSLAYNSDLQRMYFSDNERQDGLIFSLTVPRSLDHNNITANISTVVPKQNYEVMGVVYDAMTGILYWSTGTGHSILWVQVGSTDYPQTGVPLIEPNRIRHQIPMGIAIDTCKRYLYWTNCGVPATIERSTLDGKDMRTLVTVDLGQPNAIVVDQTTDRLYWVDVAGTGEKYRIETSDLNGRDRKVIIEAWDHQPFALAVSVGNVFWADHLHTSVWKLPLDTPRSTLSKEPLLVVKYNKSPLALTSAFSGKWEQHRCNNITYPRLEKIPATITKITSSSEASIIPVVHTARNTSRHCFNSGVWQEDVKYCDCPTGFSGDLCEVNECQDYCLHGTCHSDTGSLECHCHEGYTGPRCEVFMCHNYCVTGSCTIDTSGKPQCHCKEGYSGQRCEINFTQQQELKDKMLEVCSAFCRIWIQSSKEIIQPFDTCRCSEFDGASPPVDSDWHQDYLLVVLLALCSVLMVIVAVLTKKVFVLRRRPRIKKRIIVNKSVQPLTCRPSPTSGEQCEITIENCCNMNICETPCFEPDFRQPQASLTKDNNKGVKEEKKTLLGNMELPPDDLY